MDEMTVKLLNSIIRDVSDENTDDFSTFIEALYEIDNSFNENHIDAITEYTVDYLSIQSDSELSDLSKYEKEDLVEFIKNLDY